MTADPAATEQAEDAEFLRRYGPWEPFTLDEARELFDPLGIAWWIAGGQAAEAFHGVPRAHEDIDISMFRRDLPVLRAAVEGRYHLWSAGSGMLRPITDEFPDLHDQSDQAWLREHALAPWRADIVLNPDRDGQWVFRRDPDFAAPLDEVTWERDGIRYLNPEVVLAFKARLQRTKDQHDFDASLPLLDKRAVSWLADYLDRCESENPWRERLQH
jgi:hypothetical protein